jgi:potassium uptake TrkH family protein
VVGRRSTGGLRNPTQLVVGVFGLAAIAGAALLLLPFSSATGSSPGLSAAAFTSVSAITVTGLAVVDTGTAWSPFGQVVILALIQLGGFGITTLASLFAVLVSRRLGLRSRLVAQVERNESDSGAVRDVIRGVFAFYLVAEVLGFTILTIAFATEGGMELPDAAWAGLFHAVSAFNNAGFSTFSDSLTGYSGAPAVLVPVMVLVAMGGIGYPVAMDLLRNRRSPWQWSLHTKITMSMTVVLLIGGAVAFGALEWSNPDTLGPMGSGDSILNSAFGSVTARTAGFNTIDYGSARPATLLSTDALMLIGGGSASAAGGIKVGTFALLGFMIWAELRGEGDVSVFGRRVSESTQRQAVAVALLGMGSVVVGTFALAVTSGLDLRDVLFESFSALGTVGLSTGITPELAWPGRIVLMGLMFLGRLGPVTFGTALVLRRRERLYQFPEGRPLIG